MSVRFWALIGAIGCACVASSGSGRATSMEEAVRLSIATNPRVAVFIHNKEAVDEELRQARGLYLPQVDLSNGFGHELTNDFQTRSRQGSTDTRGLWRSESQIGVTQRLFDGFDVKNRVRRQKARVQAAARRVFENAEFIGLDAIRSYLEVVRQRELLALADDLIAFHLTTLESISKKARAGAGSSADVYQTEVRLERARALRARTQRDLRDAEANYIRIVGQHPADLTRPTFPATALPRDLDAALAGTQTDNPKVRSLKKDVEAAAAQIDVTEAADSPKLNLEAFTAYNNNLDGVQEYEHVTQLMVRMRWNLYRGGSDRANQREAAARMEEARSRRDEAVIEGEEDMRRAWNAYVAATERVRRLSRAVQFSIRTRDIYRQQFAVAQRTLLDVLDAETELFTTRGQLVTDEINHMQAGYRILALHGALLRTLSISAPPQTDEGIRDFRDDIGRHNRPTISGDGDD